MRGQLSRAEASSGKTLLKDHTLSMCCRLCSLPPRHSFRERCRAQLSRGGVEQHCRKPAPLVKPALQVAEISRVIRYRRFSHGCCRSPILGVTDGGMPVHSTLLWL